MPSRHLVLSQLKIAEKSSETVVIPKLLEMLAIAGAIVTIAAMGKLSQGSVRHNLMEGVDEGAGVRSRRKWRRSEPTTCWPCKANQSGTPLVQNVNASGP